MVSPARRPSVTLEAASQEPLAIDAPPWRCAGREGLTVIQSLDLHRHPSVRVAVQSNAESFQAGVGRGAVHRRIERTSRSVARRRAQRALTYRFTARPLGSPRPSKLSVLLQQGAGAERPSRRCARRVWEPCCHRSTACSWPKLWACRWRVESEPGHLPLDGALEMLGLNWAPLDGEPAAKAQRREPPPDSSHRLTCSGWPAAPRRRARGAASPRCGRLACSRAALRSELARAGDQSNRRRPGGTASPLREIYRQSHINNVVRDWHIIYVARQGPRSASKWK
eukprot:6207575-Pleurochrysis_carterae.AAC.2